MLTEIYQSQTIAEEKIAHGLVTGRVHWDCLELMGKKRDSDPGRGDPEFWRGLPKSAVHLHEGWARRYMMSYDRRRVRRRPVVLCDYKAVGIVFAREDVVGLLPPAAQARLTEMEAARDVAQETVASPDELTRTERCIDDYVQQIYGGRSGMAGISHPDVREAIKQAMKEANDKRKVPSVPSIGRWRRRE